MFEAFNESRINESPVGDNIHSILYGDSISVAKGMIHPPSLADESTIDQFGQVEIVYHEPGHDVPLYEDIPQAEILEENLAEYLASATIGKDPVANQRIAAVVGKLLTDIGTDAVEKLVDGINENLSDTGRRLEVSFSKEEGFWAVVNLVQFEEDGEEIGNLQLRFK